MVVRLTDARTWWRAAAYRVANARTLGSAVAPRIEFDEGKVLPLFGREGFCRRTHAGHPIQLIVHASIEQEAWMNVRYRVELSQTERRESLGLLSGGKHAVRKLKRAQILLAADAGAGDEEIARSVGVADSDEVAQAFRDDVARCSDMMSPGVRCLAG